MPQGLKQHVPKESPWENNMKQTRTRNSRKAEDTKAKDKLRITAYGLRIK